MGIKSWWKSLDLGDKVVIIVGAVSTACCLYVTGDAIYQMGRTREETIKKVGEELSHMEVKIDFVKKEDRDNAEGTNSNSDTFDNPILGAPVSSRSQFEMARSLYKMMDPYENEKDILTNEMRQSCLELAWDLAAIEGKTDAAIDEGLLPTQVWD